MNAVELNEIMQSDMKLWDMASKSQNDKGQLVVKTELPHGIGEYVIAFEGVDNGIGRRGAMEQWAASIRGAVDDAIGEESVTARAQQSAALTGGEAGELYAIGGPNSGGTTTISDRPTIQTHEEKLDALGKDPATRLDGLQRLCSEYTGHVRSMQQEMKALQAYVEVMNEFTSDQNRKELGEAIGDDATGGDRT